MSDLNDYIALNEKNMYKIKSVVIGETVSLSKNITEEDLKNILEISGDNNPIHHDDDFAERTIFKGRIIHGLAAVALVSAALTRLIGPGNVWLSQKFEFKNPIRINDQLTATLKILEISRSKVCTIEAICKNQDKKIILKGTGTSRLFPIKKKK